MQMCMKRKNKKNMECNTFWVAWMCVSKMCAPGSPKENISWKSFTLSQGRYRVFITWVLNLHLHPKKAQRQTEEAMLWNSSSSGLISNHSLAFCNQNIHKHRRGWWFFHFLERDWCPVFHRHSSLLFLFWLPAFSPLHWVYPTTRWRRVFCSGSSVCRTHCWLSGVLWLFRRLPGASGPTVRVL